MPAPAGPAALTRCSAPSPVSYLVRVTPNLASHRPVGLAYAAGGRTCQVHRGRVPVPRPANRDVLPVPIVNLSRADQPAIFNVSEY